MRRRPATAAPAAPTMANAMSRSPLGVHWLAPPPVPVVTEFGVLVLVPLELAPVVLVPLVLLLELPPLPLVLEELPPLPLVLPLVLEELPLLPVPIVSPVPVVLPEPLVVVLTFPELPLPDAPVPAANAMPGVASASPPPRRTAAIAFFRVSIVWFPSVGSVATATSRELALGRPIGRGSSATPRTGAPIRSRRKFVAMPRNVAPRRVDRRRARAGSGGTRRWARAVTSDRMAASHRGHERSRADGVLRPARGTAEH